MTQDPAFLQQKLADYTQLNNRVWPQFEPLNGCGDNLVKYILQAKIILFVSLKIRIIYFFQQNQAPPGKLNGRPLRTFG